MRHVIALLCIAAAACGKTTAGTNGTGAGSAGGTGGTGSSSGGATSGGCGDCGPGTVCRGSACSVVGCQGDDDCGPGERCDPTGVCRPATDPCASVRCPAGAVCRGGGCQVSPCGDAATCQANEVCDATGVCRPSSDPCAAANCVPETVCRGDGGCERVRCSGSAPCALGETCDPTGTCRPASDPCAGLGCGPGEVCRAGACTEASCADASECQAAELCRGGRCAADSAAPCLPDGGLVDTSRDPSNCGACGHVCPAPLNASATCELGSCGRGPCSAGHFDVDGAATFGCEASCIGATCTLVDGGQLVLDAPPLPEAGLVWQVLASGGVLPSAPQTNASFTNFGVLGEPTPPATGGAVRQSNARFQNVPGFLAAAPR